MRSLDVDERVARLGDGSALPFDLYLGVPVHRAPAVVEAAGLTVDGWVPVDPRTLETPWPGRLRRGRRRERRDAARRCLRRAPGGDGRAPHRVTGARRARRTAAYDGRGICYIEFGGDEIGIVEVDFFGDRPRGTLQGPSLALAADKQEFGASRIRRWFAREWLPVDARVAPAGAAVGSRA